MINWLFSDSGLFIKIIKGFIFILMFDIAFFLMAFVIIIINDIYMSKKLQRRRKHLRDMKY